MKKCLPLIAALTSQLMKNQLSFAISQQFLFLFHCDHVLLLTFLEQQYSPFTLNPSLYALVPPVRTNNYKHHLFQHHWAITGNSV